MSDTPTAEEAERRWPTMIADLAAMARTDPLTEADLDILLDIQERMDRRRQEREYERDRKFWGRVGTPFEPEAR